MGGAAFGAVADVIRDAAGIRSGDPVEVRREKLHARLGRRIAGPMLARIASLLGEMIGIPIPDGPDAVLLAARESPLLMGDAMRASWEEWLIAECRAQPVLLLLEDLHWGDGATARLIDSTLRNLGDLPLMVIALARADGRDDAIAGWIRRDAPSIKLGPLPARASERLVRDLLGGAATEEIVGRLIEQSGGNPFYLCELIRAVAAGRGDVLPDSVLGLVEARLDAEGADAKRVLRAASVFGDRFGTAGVTALLGGDRGAVAEVRRALASLSSRDLVAPVGEEGPGATEFVFSHALVREAAYAMLTEVDRATGHQLAGAFLEQNGHPDALAMAEHFRRGAEPERAARWYRRAAEKALEANDLPAAVERAERGVSPGAGPVDLGALRLVQAEAHLWLGELSASASRGAEAARLLPVGSAPWFRAVGHLVSATAKLGAGDGVEGWAVTAVEAEAAPDARLARIACLAECAKHLLFAGRHAAALEVAAAVDRAVLADPATLDPLASAEIANLRGIRASYDGDPGAAREHLTAALAGFELAGDQRNAVTLRSHLGFVLAELGDFAAAEGRAPGRPRPRRPPLARQPRRRGPPSPRRRPRPPRGPRRGAARGAPGRGGAPRHRRSPHGGPGAREPRPDGPPLARSHRRRARGRRGDGAAPGGAAAPRRGGRGARAGAARPGPRRRGAGRGARRLRPRSSPWARSPKARPWCGWSSPRRWPAPGSTTSAARSSIARAPACSSGPPGSSIPPGASSSSAPCPTMPARWSSRAAPDDAILGAPMTAAPAAVAPPRLAAIDALRGW